MSLVVSKEISAIVSSSTVNFFDLGETSYGSYPSLDRLFNLNYQCFPR